MHINADAILQGLLTEDQSAYLERLYQQIR
jgi:hypothetical protein